MGEAKEEYKLTPLTDLGTADPHEPQMASLAELIVQMNDLFTGDLSDSDLVTYARHIMIHTPCNLGKPHLMAINAPHKRGKHLLSAI